MLVAEEVGRVVGIMGPCYGIVDDVVANGVTLAIATDDTLVVASAPYRHIRYSTFIHDISIVLGCRTTGTL